MVGKNLNLKSDVTMKSLRKPLVSILAFALGSSLFGQADHHAKSRQLPHPDGVVSVEFESMDDYTDFGLSMNPTPSEQQMLAKQLRSEIERIASRYLPDDRHLSLTFLDINMAGEFEPRVAPGKNDVRVVRGIYTPSFLVSYQVTTPTGEVVSKGQRRISDTAFQAIINFRRDETLFYETELARQLIADLSRSLS